MEDIIQDRSENPEGDYPEEFNCEDDNGCYQNRCVACDNIFLGHKYRRICKKCNPDYQTTLL